MSDQSYTPVYFKEEEFKRASPACSLSDMDSAFMARLDIAREIAGIPFHVNSAYRSKEYEKKKGRSGSSMHTKGRAIDIRCITNADRFTMVDALVSAGFRRIGIASRFIHVDDGYPEASPLIWLY